MHRCARVTVELRWWEDVKHARRNGRNGVCTEMRKIEECGMERFGTLDSSEKTMFILGDGCGPQTAKQGRGKYEQNFYLVCTGYKAFLSAGGIHRPLRLLRKETRRIV